MKKTLLLLALTASLSTQAATQQDIDLALAKIKNSTDLQVVLNTSSALDALGYNLPQFINSVTVDQQVSFDKDILINNLTATEIYNILALFGQQTTIAQYQGAAIVTDTDRLLLNTTAKAGTAMSFCALSPLILAFTLS